MFTISHFCNFVEPWPECKLRHDRMLNETCHDNTMLFETENQMGIPQHYWLFSPCKIMPFNYTTIQVPVLCKPCSIFFGSKQGVCHIVVLSFAFKKYLKEKKKNYWNSNISPCKNIIFKKSSKRNQNPSKYYNFK
jgi:hypothetical protein